MELKKKVYRNMSIISFTIVLVLMVNLLIPVITKAEETNSARINMKFEVDKENSVIKVEGTIPEDYNGYELYWANKNYTKEKPTNPDENYQYLMDTIAWFENSENKLEGKDVSTYEGSVVIDSKVAYKEGSAYSVLCVAHGPQNAIMMSFNNFIPGKKEEKTSEPIKVELKNDDKKITIHASCETAKITAIKYEKSSTALKVEDFKDKGIVVDKFEKSNNVTTTITVEEYGIYYIYIENEQGSKSVEPIILNAPAEAVKDDISVELYRITDEKYGDIAVKAVSKNGKITGIKYWISDSPINVEDENVRNALKKEATEMKVYGKPTEEIVKSDSKINDDKYIAILVESSDDVYTYEYWSAPGRIGNLNKVEIAPWENTNKEEDLDYKKETEEPKKEENKEEQKQEESKEESKKEDEAPKAENDKKEEPKQEENKEDSKKEAENPKAETNKEEAKQEENKENDIKEIIAPKEETNKEEVKQEENKEDDIKEIVAPKEETNKEGAKQEENKEDDVKEIVVSKNENNKENKENKEATKQDDKKVTETSKTDSKKEESKTTGSSSNTNKNVKEGTNTIISDNQAKTSIPQTGKNDNFVVFAIVLFSVSGIFSLVKYKKARE